MDFELPAGYPQTEGTPFSNWSVTSYLGNEPRVNRGLPARDLFWESIPTCPIKKVDNSEPNGGQLIVGIAPISTSQYVTSHQSIEHKLFNKDSEIDERIVLNHYQKDCEAIKAGELSTSCERNSAATSPPLFGRLS